MHNLILEICQEREWRLNELEFYKKVPNFYVNSLFMNQKEKYFKMCIPMIYAHWEGFIVSLFRLLSNYISNQAIAYSYAPDFLILLANKKKFDYLKGNCSVEQQRRFLKEFLQALNDIIDIPAESSISANSNLNFKQFELMLGNFNLFVTEKHLKHKHGIEKLVTFRNKIAHGENSIVVKYNDIEVLIKCVNEMMDETIVLIQNYVSDEKYLKI